MRARGCLIALAVFAVLLLLCCTLVWFVGIPRLRDSVSDGLSETLSTEVSIQLSNTAGTLDPGTYTLSVTDLQEQIDTQDNSSSTSDFEMSVDANGMSISFTSGSTSFAYSGTPVARDGQLVMEDMEVDNEALGWIMPADRLGDTIETGINNYFAAQGLRIDSIALGDDEITFTVSDRAA
ncbi:MAG TPA: hypothetical protein VD767_03750 [Thermomicrobiales bacterium]|nr:hypothetical protein [Thermomicrobiales bacterium]